MILTRRSFGRLSALVGLAGVVKIVGVSVGHAQDRQFKHATSLFGDVKYPPDFKYFEYANPDAPKGGKLRIHSVGSYDSLNPFTFKGEAAAYGAISTEALMTSSLDEPSTMYGLIANEVWYPDDFSQVIYRLRPEARFHDGKTISPDDVIWSMTTLKEISPQKRLLLQECYQGRANGRPRGDLHLLGERQPRAAAYCGPAFRTSKALVDRQELERNCAQYRRNNSRNTAWFGSL